MKNELRGSQDQKAKSYTLLLYAQEYNYAFKCVTTCCFFKDLSKKKEVTVL